MSEGYSTFGNYLLLKQRAEDGLGSLWRAGEMERAGFKRIVWLRRFDQANMDRTAFETEIPMANQIGEVLKATNVARNQVLGTEGGVPYLAWDFVPSQPLDQLFERVRNEQFPVAIDNALLIVEKLASALSAALAVEVGGEPLIHGFLAPSLILVGNDGEAIVSGFGASKAFLANLDRTTVREMSASYLSPEVLSTGHSSRRSDVYSLGAILYQLLAGEPLPSDPAERAPLVENPQLALEEGPVPDDVASVLRRALAPRPEDRYSSAADFKRDLEKLLYGGAYSPTTFNLALFMDRLYRQDIEDEDRELQREKTLDVAQYFKPPKAGASDAPPVVEAAPGSKVGLYAALAGVVILLGAVGFLVLRPSGVDEDELARLVQARLEARYMEIEQELEAERRSIDELRRQLEEQEEQEAARPGRAQLTPEQIRQREQARRELEEREARLEADRQRVEQERAAEEERVRMEEEARLRAAAVVPTAVPTVPPAVPTPVPADPVEPTPVPEAAQQPASAPAAPSIGLGAPAVREGDFVERTQVDVAPQVIREEPVRLSREATRARVRASGTVILEALVDHTGAVKDVRVLRRFPTSGLGVDESCVEAVRRYRFTPATKDGVKVQTWTTVTIPVDFARLR